MPTSWDAAGGYGSIRVSDNAGSVVVGQDFAGHVAVVEFLSSVRGYISENGPVELVAAMNEVKWASRRNP